MRAASSASMTLASRTSSSARAGPTAPNRTRNSGSGMARPMRATGAPNLPLAPVMRRSQSSARTMPAPVHGPWMRATVGWGQPSTAA